MVAFLTHRPAAGTMLRGFGAPPATPTSPPAHLGQDYGWGGGDAIFAARAGRVASYGPAGAYGNRLILDHGDGFQTWYCHLSSRVAAVGAQVAGGVQVAVMGDTGNVTGKHLHFELRKAGVAVDPAPYFTSTAGGETNPIDQEDTMPKLIKRIEGNPEWSLIWPSLSGPSELERGYIVTVDAERAKWWARFYDNGQNTEDKFNRADYMAAQAVARLDHQDWLRGQPGATVPPSDLVAALREYLDAGFAAVNANIDDQPTEFKVIPA